MMRAIPSLILLHLSIGNTVTADQPKRPDLILVLARVKTLDAVDKSGCIPATVEIIKIYTGPQSLKGKTFRDSSRLEDANGTLAWPELKAEEEGIWTLSETLDGLQRTYDNRMPFSYRSRNRDNARHAQVVLLAEAIEKVERSKAGDRVPLLCELTRTDTREVAVWAMTALGKSDAPAAREYIDGLAAKPDTTLPIPIQVAMDEVLAKTRGAEWQLSKPRMALLRSWVEDKRNDDDARAALGRFDIAVQRDELPGKTATELSIVGAENAKWAWPSRRSAIISMGWLVKRGVDDEAAYDWLLAQVRKNEDIETRRTTAETLCAFIPLPPMRLKAVEEHLRTETDKTVTLHLKAAVKKAKAMK